MVQIVGVFPDIDGEQGLQAVRHRRVGIRGRGDAQSAGIDHQPGPAGAELTQGGFLELPGEGIDIAEVALAEGLDGLIVSNTTIAREGLVTGLNANETGGLSGAPLFELSTSVLRDMYRLTKGRLPIIGVGGICSGEDAYAKIRAGASLVQLYSALAYDGPALVTRIKRDMAACLAADGFAHLKDAVGADVKLYSRRNIAVTSPTIYHNPRCSKSRGADIAHPASHPLPSPPCPMPR